MSTWLAVVGNNLSYNLLWRICRWRCWELNLQPSTFKAWPPTKWDHWSSIVYSDWQQHSRITDSILSHHDPLISDARDWGWDHSAMNKDSLPLPILAQALRSAGEGLLQVPPFGGRIGSWGQRRAPYLWWPPGNGIPFPGRPAWLWVCYHSEGF